MPFVSNFLSLVKEIMVMYPCFSKPIEADCLFDCLPNSLRPNSTSGNQGDAASAGQSNKSAENAGYKTLDIVPPRVLPLLHELANQMIQAGYQQQILSIYRY